MRTFHFTAAAVLSTSWLVASSAQAQVTSGQIYRVASACDNSKVMFIKDGSTADGAAVVVDTRNDLKRAQTFKVESVGGAYKFTAQHSGKVVNVPNFSKTVGTALVQYPYKGTSNQTFRLVSVGSGYYKLQNAYSGLYMDIKGSNMNYGTPFLQYSSTSGCNQKFKFISTSTSTSTTSPAPAPAPAPAPTTSTSGSFNPDFPRIMGMNIGTKNYNESAYQAAIARTDVAILGFYPGWQTGYKYGSYSGIRAAVKAIKDRNPNMLIGQYTILSEAQDTKDSANADRAYKLNQQNWWLRTASGSRVQWTSAFAAWDTNFTRYTKPDAQGKRYPQWLAERDHAKYFKPVPELSVQFLDNVFERNRIKSADWDGDRVNDSNNDSDMVYAHREGHVAEWKRIRELKSNALLLGNTDHDISMPEYKGKLNGGFLEGMMGKSWSMYNWAGWSKMMARYHGAMANSAAPKLVGFNVHGSITNYKLMRFGLTSSLLNDGYFVYTDDAKGYSSVPWFDEYNVKLGYPTEGPRTSAWQNGVYKRTFQNGVVLVNPTGSSVTVNVGTAYKRFSGKQAPSVNNGQYVTTITIPAKDGIILIKR